VRKLACHTASGSSPEGLRSHSVSIWAKPCQDLSRHIDRKRGGQIENADQVLDEFARREDRRRLIDRVALALPILFGGGVIASVFAAFGTWTIVLIALTVLSLIRAFVAYERRDDGYLGTSELRALVPPDGTA
jgi:hypothetical protein